MRVEQFMASFGVIAEAPGGIAKLRELVGTLACKGALSTASDGDESVAHMLETVRIQREILGKTAPKVSPVEDDDAAYLLPSGWVWVRVGELLIGSDAGKSPQCEKRSAAKDEYGVLKVSAVSWGSFRPAENKALPDHIEPFVDSEVRPGDYLLSRANTGQLVARSVVVGDTPGRLLMSDKIVRLHFYTDVAEPRFFSLYNNGPIARDYYLSHASGTSSSMKNVSRKVMLALPVPLPPLAEQKRIVAKVDQLMAMLDDLEQRQEQKRTVAIHVSKVSFDSLVNAEDPDQFARAWERVSNNFGVVAGTDEKVYAVEDAVLSVAMGGRLSQRSSAEDTSSIVARAAKRVSELPSRGRRRKQVEVHLPKKAEIRSTPTSWAWTRLGAVTDIAGGVTKGRKLAGRETCALPYLRVANVQRWSLALDVMKEIEIPTDEIDKYRLQVGDVLLTEGGDWDKLGRAVVWRGEIDPCLHQNHVFRVRSVIAEIKPEWIEAWCNCRAGREYFQGAAKQTTNLASINMTQLRNLPLPVPSLEEQEDILAQHKCFRDECDRLRALLHARNRIQDRLAKKMTAV